jgi:hypothetical protein
VIATATATATAIATATATAINFLKNSYVKNVTFKKVTTKWRFAPGVGGVSPPLKESQSGSGRAGCPCRYKSFIFILN